MIFLERISDGVEFLFLCILAGVSHTIMEAEKRSLKSVLQAVLISVFVGYTVFPILSENTHLETGTVGALACLLAFLAHYLLTGLTLLARYILNHPRAALDFLRKLLTRT